MKKMKNLFFAVIMFGLIFIPTLNAAGTASLNNVTGSGVTFTKKADDNTTYVAEVKNSISTVSVSFDIVGSEDTKSASMVVKKGNETVLESLSGDLALEVGKNEFTVEVKDSDDETGTTKAIYKLEIVRKDKVAANLSGLVIKANDKNGAVQTLTPTFKSDVLEYSVTVTNDIETIYIEPEYAKDSGLVVSGNIEENYLSVGENYFFISVFNEDGETNEYEITVIREASQLVKDIKSELGVGYEVSDDYVGEDGKNYIAIGTIKTTSNGIEIVRVHLILKTENPVSTDIVAQYKKIENTPADAMYVIVTANDSVLDEEALTEIRNNGGEVVIEAHGATWVIDGSKVSKDLKKLNLKVLTGDEVNENLSNKILSLIDKKDQGLVIDFLHSGSLPKGTKISLWVGDKFNDGDILTLYYYNPTHGKLDVSVKNIKVQNGAIEIELDHCSSYVLTLASNNAQTGPMNVVFYTILALISLIGIVFLAKKKTN